MDFAVALITEAYRRALDGGEVERRFPSAYHKHLGNLRRIPFSAPQAGLVATADCLTWVEGLPYVPHRGKIDSLLHTCLFFTERHIVGIGLHGVDSQTLEIVWTTDEAQPHPPKTQADVTRGKATAVKVLRKAFGRRPFRVELSLIDVTDAMSFHVFLDAPDGHHVHRIEVLTHADRSQTRQQDMPLPVHLFRQSGVGTDQAHVYFHPTTASELEYLSQTGAKLRVTLAEDLPGTIVPSLVPSLLLFAIALVTLLFAERALPSTSEDVGSLGAAFPAFLLAVPGVASLVFRPQDSNCVVTAPLVSAISPLINAACAFSLAVLYLAVTINPRRDHSVFFAVGWSVFGILTLLILLLAFRASKKLRAELPACREEA